VVMNRDKRPVDDRHAGRAGRVRLEQNSQNRQ
jgi:hypothetical protein